jgi:hypothetical protein
MTGTRTAILIVLLSICSQVYGGWQETRGAAAIYWFSGEELDYVGRMQVNLPWVSASGHRFETALVAATNIEGTASDLTLLVRDLDYRIRFAWSPPQAEALSIELGQWGRERVDDFGQPALRWAGAGWASAGVRDFRSGSWISVRGGVVFDERQLDADTVLFLKTGWRMKNGLFFDLSVDAMTDGSNIDSDGQIGVGYGWQIGNGRKFAAALRRLWSGTPLGLGEDGWLLGLEIGEALRGEVDDLAAGPQIWGETAWGLGEDSALGRFQLGVSSPAFTDGGWMAVLFVDANVLTADETNDIYYFYHLGIERPIRDRYRTGFWLYHRSNHRLATPGDTITSLNTLETGIESPGWQRAGVPDRRLTYRARLGLVINSSFGDKYDPVVRGGAMWRFLEAGRSPFVRLEGEAGSVDRITAAAGMSFRRRWELRLEYRRDDQWFREDPDVWAVVVGTGF